MSTTATSTLDDLLQMAAWDVDSTSPVAAPGAATVAAGGTGWHELHVHECPERDHDPD